jgi:hypothetical protein
VAVVVVVTVAVVWLCGSDNCFGDEGGGGGGGC